MAGFLDLPDDLMALVLCRLRMPERARAAVICKRTAALTAQPRVWHSVDLMELVKVRRSLEDDLWEVVLRDRDIDAVLRWFCRHAAGFHSVELPPRFVMTEDDTHVYDGDRVDDYSLKEAQLVLPLLAMLSACADKLERLVIGNRERAWPPMHKECVPLVGLCSSLQTLALWQLPIEPEAASDAALATALAELSNLKALALQWHDPPGSSDADTSDDSSEEESYRLPHMFRGRTRRQPCSLTLEALTHCRKLQRLFVNGADRRVVGQLPQSWATALTALSSLHIEKCYLEGMPVLRALKDLTTREWPRDAPTTLPLWQQPCLQALDINAWRIQDRLPASLRRLVLRWGPLRLRTAAEWQALYMNAATALPQLPLLRHLVISQLYSIEGLPTSLLADAIDSLPGLRSLHLLLCDTSIAPLLGCLSRLDSFSQTQCQVQEFPEHLARLRLCTRIDLSSMTFVSEGDVERVLRKLKSAAKRAGPAPATRHFLLKGVSGARSPVGAAVVRRLRAFGGGIYVWDDTTPSGMQSHVSQIMTSYDF